jgi:hypothetical protein
MGQVAQDGTEIDSVALIDDLADVRFNGVAVPIIARMIGMLLRADVDKILMVLRVIDRPVHVIRSRQIRQIINNA